MKCPLCGAASDVLDTRPGRVDTTRRRRECHNGHRFVTVEVFSTAVNIGHIKRAAATAEARRGRWQRDQAIRRDPRPAREVAPLYGMTAKTVQAVRRHGLR